MTRHERKRQRHERHAASAQKKHQPQQQAAIQVGSEFVSYYPTSREMHEHVNGGS